MFQRILSSLYFFILFFLFIIAIIILIVTTSNPAATPFAEAATGRLAVSRLPMANEVEAAAPTQPVVKRETTSRAVEWPVASEFIPERPFVIHADRVAVIEYHYSTFAMGEEVTMTPEWWQSQMQWLADDGYTTLTSEQFVDFVSGRYQPLAKSVVLRFDVGESKFDDYSTVVIPTLRRHNFHGLFFVLASKVDEECDGVTACWSSLQQWQREGLISVESHTLYHQDYTTLTPEQIYMDAGRSKALIEQHIGQPVRGLCYPFDAVSVTAFDILKDLSYEFAVGGYTRNDRSVNFGDAEPFNLPSYYPYSSAAIYPKLSSGGRTFEVIVSEAVQ
ncbi:MAG: polysaccharide deacetylase family protein [Anaerolineales bacterium]